MRRERDFAARPDRQSVLAGAGAFAPAGCGGGLSEDRHDFAIRSTIHASYGGRPVQGSAVQSRRMELGRRNRTFGEASTALKVDVQRPTTLFGKRFAFDRWEIERLETGTPLTDDIRSALPWADPYALWPDGRTSGSFVEVPRTLAAKDASLTQKLHKRFMRTPKR